MNRALSATEWEGTGTVPHHDEAKYVRASAYALKATYANNEASRAEMLNRAVDDLKAATSSFNIWIYEQLFKGDYQSAPDRDVYFTILRDVPAYSKIDRNYQVQYETQKDTEC